MHPFNSDSPIGLLRFGRVDMEGQPSDGKDPEKKHRGRFMGKLFREKKTTINEDDVDDFLRAPSD